MDKIDVVANDVYTELFDLGKAMYPKVTSGYAIKNRGFKTIYPISNVSPRTIANYIRYNLVAVDGLPLGNVATFQYSGDLKFVVIDVVTIVPDKVEARMLTLARSQYGYYDLDNQCTLVVLVKERNG